MKKIVPFLLLGIVGVSCTSKSQHEQDLAKIDSLQKVVIDLSKELNEYRDDPANLCANLSELVKEENLQELEQIQSSLKEYHPSCSQLKDVSAAIKNIKETKAKRAAEEKAKRLAVVNSLRKEFDDVRGITWYYSKKLGSGYNHCFAYIGKNKTDTWLRLRMQYHGEDWIFFKNAYLSYDGNTIDIPFDEYREKETEVSNGVWEWLDVRIDESTLPFIRKMVNGKVVKWRLSGKYAVTKTFTAGQINGFKEILLAYDVLSKE